MDARAVPVPRLDARVVAMTTLQDCRLVRARTHERRQSRLGLKARVSKHSRLTVRRSWDLRLKCSQDLGLRSEDLIARAQESNKDRD